MHPRQELDRYFSKKGYDINYIYKFIGSKYIPLYECKIIIKKINFSIIGIGNSKKISLFNTCLKAVEIFKNEIEKEKNKKKINYLDKINEWELPKLKSNPNFLFNLNKTVGIDLEGFQNKKALWFQASDRNNVVILRMDLYINEIKSFLKTNRKFIFCDIESDIQRLPITPSKIIDIQEYYKILKGIKKASLLTILSDLFNHTYKIEKPSKNFYNEFIDNKKLKVTDLSKDHINYMKADAYITLCMYYKLKSIVKN